MQNSIIKYSQEREGRRGREQYGPKYLQSLTCVLQVNVGKSTILNRIIPRLQSELKQNLSALTMSPLPGTTIRPISFKFERSGKLYDTPGIPNMNQIFRFLTPREVFAILPSKKVWPKYIRLTTGKVRHVLYSLTALTSCFISQLLLVFLSLSLFRFHAHTHSRFLSLSLL